MRTTQLVSARFYAVTAPGSREIFLSRNPDLDHVRAVASMLAASPSIRNTDECSLLEIARFNRTDDPRRRRETLLDARAKLGDLRRSFPSEDLKMVPVTD